MRRAILVSRSPSSLTGLRNLKNAFQYSEFASPAPGPPRIRVSRQSGSGRMGVYSRIVVSDLADDSAHQFCADSVQYGGTPAVGCVESVRLPRSRNQGEACGSTSCWALWWSVRYMGRQTKNGIRCVLRRHCRVCPAHEFCVSGRDLRERCPVPLSQD